MIFRQEKCNPVKGFPHNRLTQVHHPQPAKNWVLLPERRTATKFPDLELYATGLGSTPRVASTSASSASCSQLRKSEHPRPGDLGVSQRPSLLSPISGIGNDEAP